MDDVFDEDKDEASIAATEWSRLERNRKKDGYRDGIEKGRDEKLQDGFDEGYSTSVKLSYRLGRLRGILSSLLALHLKSSNAFRMEPDNLVTSTEQLLSEISFFEESLPGILKTDTKSENTEQASAETESESCLNIESENTAQFNVGDASTSLAQGDCSTKKTSGMEETVVKFENSVDALLEKFSVRR